MTNKYMYFIANWKMFGDLRSLNSLDSVIKFSKNNKNTNFRIILKGFSKLFSEGVFYEV